MLIEPTQPANKSPLTAWCRLSAPFHFLASLRFSFSCTAARRSFSLASALTPDRLLAFFLILPSSPNPPPPPPRAENAAGAVPDAPTPMPPCELRTEEFVVARRRSVGVLKLPPEEVDTAALDTAKAGVVEVADVVDEPWRLSVRRSTIWWREFVRRGFLPGERFSLLLRDDVVGGRIASSSSSASLSEFGSVAGMTSFMSSSKLDTDSRISPRLAGLLPSLVRRMLAGGLFVAFAASGWLSGTEVHLLVAAAVLNGAEEGLVAGLLGNFLDALVREEGLLHLLELPALHPSPRLAAVVRVRKVVVGAAFAPEHTRRDIVEELVHHLLVACALTLTADRGVIVVAVLAVDTSQAGIFVLGLLGLLLHHLLGLALLAVVVLCLLERVLLLDGILHDVEGCRPEAELVHFRASPGIFVVFVVHDRRSDVDLPAQLTPANEGRVLHRVNFPILVKNHSLDSRRRLDEALLQRRVILGPSILRGVDRKLSRLLVVQKTVEAVHLGLGKVEVHAVRRFLLRLGSLRVAALTIEDHAVVLLGETDQVGVGEAVEVRHRRLRGHGTQSCLAVVHGAGEDLGEAEASGSRDGKSRDKCLLRGTQDRSRDSGRLGAGCSGRALGRSLWSGCRLNPVLILILVVRNDLGLLRAADVPCGEVQVVFRVGSRILQGLAVGFGVLRATVIGFVVEQGDAFNLGVRGIFVISLLVFRTRKLDLDSHTAFRLGVRGFPLLIIAVIPGVELAVLPFLLLFLLGGFPLTLHDLFGFSPRPGDDVFDVLHLALTFFRGLDDDALGLEVFKTLLALHFGLLARSLLQANLGESTQGVEGVGFVGLPLRNFTENGVEFALLSASNLKIVVIVVEVDYYVVCREDG
ncbi:hypothetical protein ColKHC_07066 [Colletotrichum higginsianum]|nr:hypothetical protein ColKHC_07066 [Colletotrichum higginsianum]